MSTMSTTPTPEPPARLDAAALDALALKHERTSIWRRHEGRYRSGCKVCPPFDWPCDVAALLAAYRAVLAERDEQARLAKQYYDSDMRSAVMVCDMGEQVRTAERERDQALADARYHAGLASEAAGLRDDMEAARDQARAERDAIKTQRDQCLRDYQAFSLAEPVHRDIVRRITTRAERAEAALRDAQMIRSGRPCGWCGASEPHRHTSGCYELALNEKEAALAELRGVDDMLTRLNAKVTAERDEARTALAALRAAVLAIADSPISLGHGATMERLPITDEWRAIVALARAAETA